MKGLVLESYKTDYSRPFKFLPPDEPLTEELLRRVLVGFDPSCRDRLACYVAFRALARFAGLVLGENFKRLRGEYKPGEAGLLDILKLGRLGS